MLGVLQREKRPLGVTLPPKSKRVFFVTISKISPSENNTDPSHETSPSSYRTINASTEKKATESVYENPVASTYEKPPEQVPKTPIESFYTNIWFQGREVTVLKETTYQTHEIKFLGIETLVLASDEEKEVDGKVEIVQKHSRPTDFIVYKNEKRKYYFTTAFNAALRKTDLKYEFEMN